MNQAEIVARTQDLRAWAGAVHVEPSSMPDASAGARVREAADLSELAGLVVNAAAVNALREASVNPAGAERRINAAEAFTASDVWNRLLDGERITEGERRATWQALLALQSSAGDSLPTTTATRRTLPPIPVAPSSPARPSSESHESSNAGAFWGALALLVLVGVASSRR